jgi:hypothetical protein
MGVGDIPENARRSDRCGRSLDQTESREPRVLAWPQILGDGDNDGSCCRCHESRFDHLGFEKLVFANAVGNVRSRRIKEKTGARQLRTEPAKFVNPLDTEREILEITKDEWNAFRERFSRH